MDRTNEQMRQNDHLYSDMENVINNSQDLNKIKNKWREKKKNTLNKTNIDWDKQNEDLYLNNEDRKKKYEGF